jgi:hypothetical protein
MSNRISAASGLTKTEALARANNFGKNIANGAVAYGEIVAAGAAFASTPLTTGFGLTAGIALTVHGGLSLSSSVVLGVCSIFTDQTEYQRLENSLAVVSLPGMVTLLGGELYSGTTGNSVSFDSLAEISGYGNALLDTAGFFRATTKYEPAVGAFNKATKGYSLLKGAKATYGVLGSNGSSSPSSPKPPKQVVQPSAPKPAQRTVKSKEIREPLMIGRPERNVDDARGIRDIQERQLDRTRLPGGGRSYYA